MVIVVCPDGCHQHGIVDGVVVGKLRQQDQFDPVVLLVVANAWEVLLHCLVLLFGLTVRLWVERGRVAVIDTEVGANSVPKSTGKLCAMICVDIVRYSSFADHMVEDHLC